MTAGGVYTIGIDFGTASARAILVDTANGNEIATAVHEYTNGVIDTQLPESGVPLPPEWALQDPDDYIAALQATIPAVLRSSGIPPDQVRGVGIDFTSCTMLPTLGDGTPLCRLPEFRAHPHAWVKLWKHHAAQPHADRINALAEGRGEGWLLRYGGRISSEWFFPKALQILEEAPEIYAAAGRLIEAADWVVWQLCGRETRNACTAGYKAIHQDGDFPAPEFLAALNPGFADIVETRMLRDLSRLGDCAGGLTTEAAGWTGLLPGTPVAVANVDAHVTLPATGSVSPGTFVMIMGTSTCHVLTANALFDVEGMCGVVSGGIVPGLYGYEAGQSAVGDIFGWFTSNFVDPAWHRRAEQEGVDIHSLLADEAGQQAPGAHGLLALDWMNGNRSVLVDTDLSGVILGLSLATRPPDVYRALLEATAFGTRMIIEGFEEAGVPIKRVVAAGGLPGRNPLLMQISADVYNREIQVIRSDQAPAVGSAIQAAVAAGIHPDLAAAAAAMGGIAPVTYRPDPAQAAVYDTMFEDYRFLHDLLGRSGASEPGGVLKRMRARRRTALRSQDQTTEVTS